MPDSSKFIVSRRDRVNEIDYLVLEKEGLTIGRLSSSDLVLNHPWVSRVHAGIKQIDNYFWIFNLSNSNRTILNGLLVDRAPLADGDTVRIGPYRLRIRYGDGPLWIRVEMEFFPQESALVSGLPSEGEANEEAETLLMQRPAFPSLQVSVVGVKMGFTATGLLSGVLPAPQERVLALFWEKRKREAGRIKSESPFQPKAPRQFGKTRFHWIPTLDLRMPWPKSYFAWGSLITGTLSLLAVFAFQQAYSPGPISTAHAAVTISARKNIAKRANHNTCSECHRLTSPLEESCTECHQTTSTQQADAFQPIVYKKHQREGLTCLSCHTEHRGVNVAEGLVRYGLCSTCHNGTYRIRSGEKAGHLLPVPHGGSLGYPVSDNRVWTWKGLTADQWTSKKLPPTLAKLPVKEQFHLIHQLGKLKNRGECFYCHSKGRPLPGVRDTSPKQECRKCHAVSYTDGKFEPVKANCNTCHQQHGQSEDLRKLVAATSKDPDKVKAFLAGLTDLQTAEYAPSLTPATGGLDLFIESRIVSRRGVLASFGALSWYGWVGLVAVTPLGGLLLLILESRRSRSFVRHKPTDELSETVARPTKDSSVASVPPKTQLRLYPHPEVNALLCIGCHACVEACPHDVLAIVNGIATPVAPEQCMEDTACQVECPTSPKACVVINTTKKIPPRKVPKRDQRFQTNVEGIYIIGDVSGVPLIKNAINEGAQVIEAIDDEIRAQTSDASVQYDLAIIGAGPAGLSAAVIAKQRKLRSVVMEQDKIVSTIQNYPAGKYVFFKPDTAQAKGGIPLWGVGEQKELILQSWMEVLSQNGVEVHEEETCTKVTREGNHFKVLTEKGEAKEKVTYTVLKVVLAIGNRGTPMKLKVPGEELKMPISVRDGSVGTLEDKVKYKLSNPDDFVDKKCIVVGAGNSAIEAAVDLAGFQRDGAEMRFLRSNEVTLVVRSDLKGDLKLGNKMNLFDCIDAGRIRVYYRTAIKEIRETEVVLMDSKSQEEKTTVPNDFIFALIGGDRPTKFLESLGIKIG